MRVNILSSIKRFLPAVAVISIICSISTEGYSQQSVSSTAPPFLQRQITPSDKEYTENFWQPYSFNIADLIKYKEQLKSVFIKYIVSVKDLTTDQIGYNFTELMTLDKHSRESLIEFYDLFDKYIYNSSSPLRDEEAMIYVLNALNSSNLLTDLDKERVKFQLEMAMKNRVGTAANDFEYFDSKGVKHNLYDIKSPTTLLYFANMDCHSCKETRANIKNSKVIDKLLHSDKLKVVTIYIDSDWISNSELDSSSEIYNWISGSEIDNSIEKSELYNVSALPSLYILDSNKKVIIKDANFPEVERYLTDQLK